MPREMVLRHQDRSLRLRFAASALLIGSTAMAAALLPEPARDGARSARAAALQPPPDVITVALRP